MKICTTTWANLVSFDSLRVDPVLQVVYLLPCLNGVCLKKYDQKTYEILLICQDDKGK